MIEAPRRGRRVVLTGSAEPVLIDATEAAFVDRGADVDRVAPVELGSAGRHDVSVCFAAMPSGMALSDIGPDELSDSVTQALLGPQRCAMISAGLMRRAGGGSIVIVGGLDATHAYPRRAAAAVAMGGLLGLIRAMAVELSGSSIRANLVLAGPLGDADGGPPADLDGPMLQRTLLRSPSGRLGRPAEAAAAIRFVASPDAAFMTGQTICVDGGWASLHQAPYGMRFP